MDIINKNINIQHLSKHRQNIVGNILKLKCLVFSDLIVLAGSRISLLNVTIFFCKIPASVRQFAFIFQLSISFLSGFMCLSASICGE